MQRIWEVRAGLRPPHLMLLAEAVETVFAELAKCRQLKRGVFPSVVALQEAATLLSGEPAPGHRRPPPKEQLAELAAARLAASVSRKLRMKPCRQSIRGRSFGCQTGCPAEPPCAGSARVAQPVRFRLEQAVQLSSTVPRTT